MTALIQLSPLLIVFCVAVIATVAFCPSHILARLYSRASNKSGSCEGEPKAPICEGMVLKDPFGHPCKVLTVGIHGIRAIMPGYQYVSESYSWKEASKTFPAHKHLFEAMAEEQRQREVAIREVEA